MRATMYELVTGYASATGCACKAEKGSSQASLSVEGLEIQIGLVESSGMLAFQTGVALLPLHDREELCIMLLAANNLFSKTGGFTLGVDEEQELVTLQLAWDMSRLDAEGFAHIVHNLLSVAADWMIRLNEWRPGQGGAAHGVEDMSTIPPFNFLQV